MHKLEETTTTSGVVFAIFTYSLCSSTLLLANKLAVSYLPLPAVVSFIQIVSSCIIIFIMKWLGMKIDGLEWEKVKAYSLYILAFVISIYANMQALTHSNVETVIVFRACTPISVCIVEYLFMERQFPNLRSLLSLVLVALGACFYCFFDSQFYLNGLKAYTWVSIYFILITFEMTYGKKLTSAVKMESVWGPVLYCNFLSAIPMFLLGYFNGDFVGVSDKLIELPADGATVLLFSCIVGTLIGYTGWQCRGMVSATTYTLVGVVNKFVTVILNVLLWDKHSSMMGLVAVVFCLFAGTFYQQSPRREPEGLGRSSTSHLGP